MTTPTRTDRDRSVEPPPLRGRFAWLVPVQSEHFGFLYELAVGVDTGFRWRYLGGIPSYERFVAEFFHGALAQFVVVTGDQRQPCGVVGIFGADLRNGTAQIDIAIDPEHRRRVVAIEAAALLIDYVFATWPLRKLYAETSEWNVPQFEHSVARHTRLEGRLLEHEYYDGRYWDRLIFAIHRADWQARRKPVRARRSGQTPVPRAFGLSGATNGGTR